MAKTFTYPRGGGIAVETVPDDLADYYRVQPGYTEVIDADAAAELTGADLDQAARELAGITDPGHTPADEKRAAIVAATAAPTDTLGVGDKLADDLEPDPTPAPVRGGKSTTTKEN